jgi:hypothetical protein
VFSAQAIKNLEDDQHGPASAENRPHLQSDSQPAASLTLDPAADKLTSQVTSCMQNDHSTRFMLSAVFKHVVVGRSEEVGG